MKLILKWFVFLHLVFINYTSFSQSNNPAPYCLPQYSYTPCSGLGPSNTMGNTWNDFIDCFNTSGAVTNIINNNSGCNGLPNNYIYYCQQYLLANPGQSITCNLKSGLTYAQVFSIFIDWNQNGQFDLPTELVSGISGVAAAGTWTVLSFIVPNNQANGIYRMRVRCSYANIGNPMSPCGTYEWGETEDYNIQIGSIPPPSPNLSVTASPNVTVCSGQTASLNASSSGTIPTSFNWTGPNNYTNSVQNPVILNTTFQNNGFYHVSIGTSTCPLISSTHVQVYSLFINLTDSMICSGTSVTLTASGSSNYTWAPGSSNNSTLIVSPSVTTVYSVSGSSTVNCTAMGTATLTVKPAYSVNVSSSSSVVCAGQQVILTATGAQYYSWLNGPISSPINVTPTINTIYTVTGTGSLCPSSASISISVNSCLSLYDISMVEVELFIYENPFHELLKLKGDKELILELRDINGKIIIAETKLNDGVFDLRHLTNGLYFLSCSNGHRTKKIKVIKD